MYKIFKILEIFSPGKNLSSLQHCHTARRRQEEGGGGGGEEDDERGGE